MSVVFSGEFCVPPPPPPPSFSSFRMFRLSLFLLLSLVSGFSSFPPPSRFPPHFCLYFIYCSAFFLCSGPTPFYCSSAVFAFVLFPFLLLSFLYLWLLFQPLLLLLLLFLLLLSLCFSYLLLLATTFYVVYPQYSVDTVDFDPSSPQPQASFPVSSVMASDVQPFSLFQKMR